MLEFVPNVPGPIYSSTLSHLALGAELWNTSRGFLVLQLLAGFSLVGGPGSRLEGTEGKGRRGLLTLSFLSEERGFPGGSDSTKTRRAKSLQSCPTLWDSMDLSLPGSSVHGMLQTRILEWIAMPSSRGSSRLRDHTRNLLCLPALAGRFFTISAS